MDRIETRRLLKMEKIGLIAGSGRFPLIFTRAVRAQGLAVIAVAHRGETDREIETAVNYPDSACHWIQVGQLNRLIRIFKEAGVQKVVMAGGINKARFFNTQAPDGRALKLMQEVASNQDDPLLRAVAGEIESEGMQVVSSTDYLSSIRVGQGVMTDRAPTEEEWSDIRSGWEIAKTIGHLEIGQCVVIKQGIILAVEAVEGTDAAIRRGGELCLSGAVVVKVSKPHQDLRFDVPTVGPSTLEVMRGVRASALALEAGKALILDRELTLETANRAGITIVGVEKP